MENKALEKASPGVSIFVDTNILIYHLLEDELYGVSCKNFLKRVEEKELTAFTSPIVIAESLFIYLRVWIIKHKKIAPKKVLEYLKQHRGLINEVNFQKPQILFTILKSLPIGNAAVKDSYSMMKLHNLLPNDAINVSLIKRHNISAIATNDNDFDNIKGLDVLKPTAI
ncbi:MAG: PIN domain-containing protein [Nitrospirae bacterium]|nr:PIN domain-containing protein [Nitrospirota bacterium]